MASLGTMLNLQPHTYDGITFYGPIDLEGHIGKVKINEKPG